VKGGWWGSNQNGEGGDKRDLAEERDENGGDREHNSSGIRLARQQTSSWFGKAEGRVLKAGQRENVQSFGVRREELSEHRIRRGGKGGEPLDHSTARKLEGGVG